MRTNYKYSIIIILLASFFLISCKYKPEKIAFGKDTCAECKMTIMDPKFGAEIVSKKGKIYKFDDTHCIAAFLEREAIDLNNIAHTLFINYNEPHDFIKARNAEFLVSSQLKSPMGGHAAAFKNRAEADKASLSFPGSKVTSWATLYNILIK